MSIDLDIHTLTDDQYKNFKSVDIREPDECAAYAPQTTDITFIPLSEIHEKIGFFTKDNSYLIVCARGSRSHYLAEALQAQGIHALSVNNGMTAFNKYLNDHGHARA